MIIEKCEFDTLKKFKNLPELLDYFKDETVCKQYYKDIRWKGHVTCVHCNHPKVYITNRGYKCAKCLKKFSVISGTIFENTKLPLRTWFCAMYLILSSKKGISSVQLSIQLGITQRSSWFLLHRIREVLKTNSESKPLTGTVEADETYVGGKTKNKHKDKRAESTQGRSLKDKIPVVGLVERNGRVLTFIVEDTSAKTLESIIDNNISATDTIIVTDAYKSYVGLSKKYKHIVVKHNDGTHVVVEGDHKFHTQNIENFWSIFKRGYIGIYHYMSKQHMHRYTTEFGYRYNTKKSTPIERFTESLSNANKIRITYKELIQKAA